MHRDAIPGAARKGPRSALELEIGAQASRDGPRAEETSALLQPSNDPGPTAAGSMLSGAQHPQCSPPARPHQLTPLGDMDCQTCRSIGLGWGGLQRMLVPDAGENTAAQTVLWMKTSRGSPIQTPSVTAL